MKDWIIKIIIDLNERKTRPDLLLQHRQTKQFYSYATMEPEDVIAHKGYEVALTEAFLQRIAQDEWGKWFFIDDTLETCSTREVEIYFTIIQGGTYKVEYDVSRIEEFQFPHKQIG